MQYYLLTMVYVNDEVETEDDADEECVVDGEQRAKRSDDEVEMLARWA